MGSCPGRRCCGQKIPGVLRAPGCGAAPAPTPVCRSARRASSRGFPHARVWHADQPTPRLGNKVIWLDAGATAASDHPGAGLHRGSARRVRLGPVVLALPPSEYQAHLSSCADLYQRQIQRRAPLCTAGQHKNPCLTAEAPPPRPVSPARGPRVDAECLSSATCIST